MNKRSNTYWDRRARQRMESYHRDADKTIKVINKAYDRAVADLNKQIDGIFETFAKNGELSPSEARRILNQRIPNPLLNMAKRIYPRLKSEKSKKWLLTKMNAPAYRARITRLEALREQVYLQSKVIADVEISMSTESYMNTIKSAYYRNMYDMQKGLGIGFNFAQISNKTVETILKRPWSGSHFSTRIWSNTDVLANQLSEIITGGFLSGSSISHMSKLLQDRANISKFVANRLIRTETTYMANAGEMESYEEADIDKYQFVATLDSRTSEKCRAHDLKVYEVNQAKPGENMPPLHPFCRSTTIAYFSDLSNMERRAKDSKGNTITIPANMTYADWYAKYGHTEKKVEIDLYLEQKKELKQAIKNGEYNLKHNLQHYRKHSVGTNEYNDYVERNAAKGKQKPSYLTVSFEDAQVLIDKHAGSGMIKIQRNGEWDKKEVITTDKPIGVHINQQTGKETVTKSFKIHYGKKGVHIVPTLTDEG
jgi:SPP1 gp7 family putative phage head morphogenesis protein